MDLNNESLGSLDKLALINSAILFKLTLENEEASKNLHMKMERLAEIERKLDIILEKLDKLDG